MAGRIITENCGGLVGYGAREPDVAWGGMAFNGASDLIQPVFVVDNMSAAVM
jgi:hypothetical protein